MSAELSPKAWLSGPVGQQVELCSTHAIMLFMHMHALNMVFGMNLNRSHKTHSKPCVCSSDVQ